MSGQARKGLPVVDPEQVLKIVWEERCQGQPSIFLKIQASNLYKPDKSALIELMHPKIS